MTCDDWGPDSCWEVLEGGSTGGVLMCVIELTAAPGSDGAEVGTGGSACVAAAVSASRRDVINAWSCEMRWKRMIMRDELSRSQRSSFKMKSLNLSTLPLYFST